MARSHNGLAPAPISTGKWCEENGRDGEDEGMKWLQPLRGGSAVAIDGPAIYHFCFIFPRVADVAHLSFLGVDLPQNCPAMRL